MGFIVVSSLAFLLLVEIGLLAVTFVLALRSRNSSVFAAVFLFLCFAFGLDADKLTNRTDRCEGVRGLGGDVGVLRDADPGEGPTNFSFAAYTVTPSNESFAAEWPEWMLPYGSRIELHEKLFSLTNDWTPIREYVVEPGQTNLCDTLSLTNGHPGIAFKALYGDSLSITFPSLSTVVGSATGRRVSVAVVTDSSDPVTLPVAVDRTERPAEFPPSDPIFAADPFAYVDGLVYDPTNETVTADGTGAFTLATGDQLFLIAPKLSFGSPHSYSGEGLRSGSSPGSMRGGNRDGDQHTIVSPYPLDEPCLWEGWHEGTDTVHGCSCRAELDLGCDISSCTDIVCEVTVEDDTAVARVLLGDLLVWSNSYAHAEHDSSGGRSDYLSSDGCSSCGSCADGDCDAFDGPSAGSVRFRVSLGSPSEGHVSGFLWFDRDSVFLPTPSSFSLLSRSDARVTDSTSGGTRTVACSDRGGRTIAVSPIQDGVRLSVTFTATGAPDRTWEVTRDSGAMRFRKFNAGGVLMSDASYAPSCDTWAVTDNVSGITEVKASTGDVLSWENGFSRTVETVSACGAVTGSHVRVVSEVVGWGDYAVLRETERSEKCAGGAWRTSRATYWDDYGSRRNGQPCLVWGDDRAWSWTDYDELGRETFRLDQRDGSAAPDEWEWFSMECLPCGDAFATVTDYEPHPGDSCHTNDWDKARTVSRYVVSDCAATLIARTWTRYARAVAANGWPTVAETTIRACSQVAGIDDPGNAVSTVVRYDDETSAVPYLLRGETISETDEDGVIETHCHTVLSNSIVRTVVSRTKEGCEAKTRDVTERDLAYGLTLYEATQLTADPGVEFGWRRHVYDSRNRLRFTQYDDGSSETNDYSCCQLLSRTDRSGAKTIHTSTPGQEHLYWADEKVYLAELPKNAYYYYDLGSLNTFNAAFQVDQHFYDAFGRETNTVTRPGRYSSNGSTFSWPGGSSRTAVISYPEGHSDISESVDERGLRTTTLRLCCGSSETTVVEERLPGADIPDVVTTNVSVRGGMSSTFRVADGHAIETRNYSEYASDGTRLAFSIAVSDDRGVVTNSVAAYDFLGRTVCIATPVSCVSNSYDGASARVLSSFDSSSGTAITNLYDRLGVDVGSIAKGVATECATDYELASSALWRVETESACAAGVTGSVRVVRTRLTGLSDGLRSEFFTTTDGAEDEHGFSSYDSAANDLTETVVSQTMGERTRKSRFGRTIEASSPNGAERMEYDFFGRLFVTSRSFPSLGIFSESEILAYNVFGDVIERYFRQARGHSSAVANNFAHEEFGYDARGNRTSSSNAAGDTVLSSWDSHGRLLGESGDTYRTIRNYDSSGCLVSLSTTRDGASRDSTQWSYDAATGVRTAKTYADDTAESFTHAADGLPLRTTRPDGSWTENLYDGMRRGVGEDSSDPSCAYGLSLDAFGRVAAATNAFAAYAYARSHRGLATNETATVCGIPLVLTRAEDGYGRLAGTGWGANGIDVVSYRADGEMASVSNADVVVEYAYDAIGDDIGCRLSLVGGTSFERIVLRDPCRRELVASVTNSSAVATNAFAYSYDLVGRPVSRNTDTFAYNSRGEVTNATVAANASAYVYDGIGNLSTSSVATGGLPAVATSYYANSLNQYESIWSADDDAWLEHSENGDMIRFAERGFLYDAKSRLVVAGGWVFDEERYLAGDYDNYDELYSFEPVVSNRYDHLDRRVQKLSPAATHTYFYDGWMLIKEIIANTNGTTDVIEYHWGKDLSGTIGGAGGVGGLLYLKRNGAIYVPWYDAYGNVMGYWDAQGNVVAEYTYDAFGKLISSSGPMADVFAIRYSTKYFDVETGLYYYGYRFYSPELMRWITRDPIGEEGGVNLYAFCENSPVDAFDEFGLWTAASESAGKSRRVYKFEDGDTLESLAKIVGLDSKEWQNWALSEKSTVADKTTASKIANNSKPGCYVSVPNVWISADLLRGGNWYWDPIVNQGGTIGRFFGTTLLTSSNYMIVKPDNAKELISALTDNKGDVWGLTVFAHGNKWGQIVMPRENHLYGETWTDTDTVVTLVKQNGYKIAKAYMMQCYSAYKGITPNPDVKQVDFGAKWRSVSVEFFGYVGENVLLLDAVPSRRPRRRGGKRR